jgi:hypothetical protein
MAGNGKALINLATAERVPHTEVVGATPMWEWVGDDATVLSY